jgi:penicillin-binding protein 1A
MAGKTGTPHNWSDAWAVGYSPYYTTAIWFGFDKPGNSLGVNLTGSTLAGPVWADFMREVHQGLPFKDFAKPSTGIIDMTVCTKSGLLRTSGCPGNVTMPFLEGTQPSRYCDLHDAAAARTGQVNLQGMRFDTMLMDSGDLLDTLKLPELRLDLPESPRRPQPATRPAQNSTRGRPMPQSDPAAPAGTPPRNTRTDWSAASPIIPDEEFDLELPDYNPLLD